MITLYILQGNLSGKKYIGITNNLQRRLQEHKNKMSKGGQVLGEFKLIHTEIFDDYSAARDREKFLKSGQGRKWMKKNLNRHGPPEAGKASP